MNEKPVINLLTSSVMMDLVTLLLSGRRKKESFADMWVHNKTTADSQPHAQAARNDAFECGKIAVADTESFRGEPCGLTLSPSMFHA